MRWLRTILALMPCGKPQAAHFVHVVELLQWLPGRVHFTGLEHYGGRSARTHARWFGRPFPFARLAVAALGAGGHAAGRGGHRGGRRLFPLCPAVPGHRPVAPAGRADTGRETTVDTALALLRKAVAAGAKESLGTRWVVAAGGDRSRTFVEGVRELDRHAVGRLRKDSVLRFPYTGPHERRPGRRRPCDGCFDRRDRARMARTTLDDEAVDLYHAVQHGKTWPCWLQVVHVLPRGADPQTKEGVLRDGTDRDLAPARLFRIYGARCQIEFAFRDAQQHLGLTHGQACSQAKLHFHFNIVFAALFWTRLQARLRAQQPLGPFSLRDRKAAPFRRQKSTKALPTARPRAETPSIPRLLAAPSRRHARGCAHPLSKRGCPAPEHYFPNRPDNTIQASKCV